jgi:hypothetical protein
MRLEASLWREVANMLTRRRMTALTLATLASPVAATAATKPQAKLYKNPDCGCCAGYARYLRAHGFEVTEVATADLPQIKKQHGVPEALEGCHTTLIGAYVVEGHVPIGPINKLLAERPRIKGISLPGMPEGSPGMTGRKKEPFTILEIADGEPRIYARE